MVVLTRQVAKKTIQFTSIALCAVILQACATTNSSKQAYRDAIGANANTQADGKGLDPIASAAFWGTRYDREPENVDVAVKFTAALRKIGSHKEALKVITKVSYANPDNADVSFEFGKTLIEDSRAFEAVRHLEFAQNERPNDWRVLSAFGVALDQIGEHEAAQQKYNLALNIAPDAVSVLNNKGLSYALAGDLNKASNVLRAASGNRRSDARVRQNLALVSALKGDLKGAERLARSDLPPQVAENNVAFFQSLLSQPAYWQDFAASSANVPSFETAPANAAPVDASTLEVPKEPRELPALEEFPLFEPVPEIEKLEEEDDEDNADDLIGAPLVLAPVVKPTNASLPQKDDEEE